MQSEDEKGKSAPRKQNKGVKIAKIVFNILFYALCLAIIAGSAVFAFSNDPHKSYGGFRLYYDKTESMVPPKDDKLVSITLLQFSKKDGDPQNEEDKADNVLAQLNADSSAENVNSIVRANSESPTVSTDSGKYDIKGYSNPAPVEDPVKYFVLSKANSTTTFEKLETDDNIYLLRIDDIQPYENKKDVGFLSGAKGGFHPGDLLIVKMGDVNKIQIGDIVTYKPNDTAQSFVTHRVVEIIPPNDMQGLYFRTKGDHNNTIDSKIKAEQVVGTKVISIRYLGYGLNFVRSNIILCLVFIVSAFGLVIVLRYYFSTPSNSKNSKKKPGNK
jgi:signal peptidase I